MIDGGGHQNAKHDRPREAKFCGQDKCKKLGFIGDSLATRHRNDQWSAAPDSPKSGAVYGQDDAGRLCVSSANRLQDGRFLPLRRVGAALMLRSEVSLQCRPLLDIREAGSGFACAIGLLGVDCSRSQSNNGGLEPGITQAMLSRDNAAQSVKACRTPANTRMRVCRDGTRREGSVHPLTTAGGRHSHVTPDSGH